jgi:hypothetical protein
MKHWYYSASSFWLILEVDYFINSQMPKINDEIPQLQLLSFVYPWIVEINFNYKITNILRHLI